MRAHKHARTFSHSHKRVRELFMSKVSGATLSSNATSLQRSATDVEGRVKTSVPADILSPQDWVEEVRF